MFMNFVKIKYREQHKEFVKQLMSSGVASYFHSKILVWVKNFIS